MFYSANNFPLIHNIKLQKHNIQIVKDRKDI